MKKTISSIVMILLLFCTSTCAFAAEVPDNTSGDVYAKYAGNTDNLYKVILEDKTPVTIQIQDSVEMTIVNDNSNDKGLLVVITQITTKEKDAYEYVTGITDSFGTEPYAWYIAFFRNGKEVEPQGNITISIAVPNGYEESNVYYFNENLKDISENVIYDDSKFTINSKNSGYYLLLKQSKINPTCPSEPENTEPSSNLSNNDTESTTVVISSDLNDEEHNNINTNNSATSPQTGDATPISIYCVVILLSFIILLLFKRRNKTNQ